ncbi:MAG: DUF1674 domain-containing protein [Alphaproteobacteria bacterium]|nr:DUF1674 domain-containing protein [Alphaproteobacteria bacterium]
MPDKKPSKKQSEKQSEEISKEKDNSSPKEQEFGGAKGPEPTRYGDWEHGGRCSDF